MGIDTSGDSLHKRGYRELSSKAPITETLAAALILLTPWRKDRILVDPFCGSGTFPIEAAMIAANIAPGMNLSLIHISLLLLAVPWGALPSIPEPTDVQVLRVEGMLILPVLLMNLLSVWVSVRIYEGKEY